METSHSAPREVYFYHQELLKAAPGSTYRDVFDRAAPRVTAANPSQHPQLEGAADRVLFGTGVVAPDRFIALTRGKDGQVRLAGGAAHGLTSGSVWAIYPPGTKSPEPEKALGRVTIALVGGLSSTVAPVEGFDLSTVPDGARAFEESHDYGDLRLAVRLVDLTAGDGTAATGVRQRIEKSKLLNLVENGADDCIYLLPAGDPDSRKGAVPMLATVKEPSWALVGRDGQMLSPPGPIAREESLKRMIDNLELIARYRNALAIANPNPADPLKGKVDLVLLRLIRQDAQKQWIPAGPDANGQVNYHEGDQWVPAKPGSDGEVAYREGDLLGIRLINNTNDPIFVTVLDFGLTYRVEPLYPKPNSKPQLAPGTFDYAVRPDLRGDELLLSVA